MAFIHLWFLIQKSSPSFAFFLPPFLPFFLSVKRQRENGERIPEKQSSHPLVYYLNAYRNWGLGQAKARAENSVWVSSVGIRASGDQLLEPSLPSSQVHINRKLESDWN